VVGSARLKAVPFHQIVPFKDMFFEGRTSEDARAYIAAEWGSAGRVPSPSLGASSDPSPHGTLLGLVLEILRAVCLSVRNFDGWPRISCLVTLEGGLVARTIVLNYSRGCPVQAALGRGFSTRPRRIATSPP
jgi:hypothetical protein